MTDREVRQRLVDLSVLAASALCLAGGLVVIEQVDATPRAPAPAATPTRSSGGGDGAVASSAAPAPGLVPAPPRRRRVVVRRSRPS